MYEVDVVPYLGNTMSEREVLRELLDDLPYGASALGRDAGVSDRLLRMIRDGDRPLTARVRDDLAAALRRRVARLRSAIEALESLNLN